MYINYSVEIEKKTHEIRVAIPDTFDDRQLQGVMRFAIITAILEHAGYLPAGVTHAVAWERPLRHPSRRIIRAARPTPRGSRTGGIDRCDARHDDPGPPVSGR